MTRLTLKSLAARPLRTALTTLAIVLGVALVAGSLTLTDTQRKAADSLSASSYDGTEAVVSARTAFDIDLSEDWSAQRPTVDAALLDKVRAVPQVRAAVGDVTDMEAKIIGKDGKPLGQGPYFGVGLDAGAPGAAATTPFRLDRGRWAAGPGEVVIDKKTAGDEGYRIGDRIQVSGRGEARTFTLTGIAMFGDVESTGVATTAIFDLEVAQDLFAKDGGYDAILVDGREGVPAPDVRSALSNVLGTSASVQSAAEHDRFTFDGLANFISIIRIVLLAFGGVAILVGALTIVNSLSITLAQRTRELGLLRLVGASRRQVLGAVLGEALVMGIGGSIVGLGAGYLLAQGLQSLFAGMGLDLPQAGTVFGAGTVAIGLLVGTLVTLVAGLVPAIRSTRVPPVVALREAGEGSRKVGLAGRAIRPVVSLLGRPAERIGGIAGSLARRNALRNPGPHGGHRGRADRRRGARDAIAVLAAGPARHDRGHDRPPRAGHARGDRPSTAGRDRPEGPRRPWRPRRGVEGVNRDRQDVGAARDKERVKHGRRRASCLRPASGPRRFRSARRGTGDRRRGLGQGAGPGVGERFDSELERRAPGT
jgi:putative ABC transport system permease protein